jgi:Na+-transporting methylmalonyl-CoA/oxaloacetate decarboxylase gamma subunit
MLLTQMQTFTQQPLLTAIIVITVINLLISFVLLSRMSVRKGTNEETPVRETARNENPVPKRVYARNSDVNAEIAAVISAALHLHANEVHDFESTVLTIKKVAKAYSPWSSKIYGLRKNPR